MLEENLGVQIDYSAMAFNTYQERLATDPPQIWSTNWIADYPGPNDFLGVLLGTGSTANQGGWSSQPFDDAITEAHVRRSPEAATEAYGRAMAIVRDDAPTVPVTYGTSTRSSARGCSARRRPGPGSCGWPASRGRHEARARPDRGARAWSPRG